MNTKQEESWTIWWYIFAVQAISVLSMIVLFSNIHLTGMEEKTLKLGILQDVLNTLDCPQLPDFGGIGQKQVEKLVQEETILSRKDVSIYFSPLMILSFFGGNIYSFSSVHS